LRFALAVLSLSLLGRVAGCSTGPGMRPVADEQLLTVDFQEDRPLEYKFVTRRQISIDWDPEKKMSRPGRAAVEKSTEQLDLVMEYNPKEVDPFGVSTIEAKCKSARVTRSKRTASATGKDAVEYFAGRTFVLKVGPNGRIEDYSQLDELIKEIGKKAFRPDSSRGRIKEPDMICDFIATQWFLWDPVSSIEDPVSGLKPGQTWRSQLSVPSPMVMRKARDVEYKLVEIKETERGKVAVIDSTYTLAESVPADWPVPYFGRFQMAGTFGFLGGYRIKGLQGRGRYLFNITTGQAERYDQQYELKIQAAIPMGISVNPFITIDQSISMRLVR